MQRPLVLVATPLGVRTGGPEACHQLVAMINELGWDAALFPMAGYEHATAVAEYDFYGCNTVREFPSRGRVHLVIPEIWPMAAARYRRCGITMWWLSVDNSRLKVAQQWVAKHQMSLGVDDLAQGSQSHHDAPQLTGNRLVARARAAARPSKLAVAQSAVLRRGVGHLAQSHYAELFCREALARPVGLMSDYLRPVSAEMSTSHWSGGDGTVWFNGARGAAVVDRLRIGDPELRFQPIAGMSHDDVLERLTQGSAYLEVGRLPGRDRLPREAARQGLPVVMLGRGAGQLEADFPHLGSNRIHVSSQWESAVVNRLRQVLADPILAARQQHQFRTWIHADRDRFRQEVSSWLDQLARHYDS